LDLARIQQQSANVDGRHDGSHRALDRVEERAMSDGAVEFLRQLGRRGHESRWAKVSGRARLELTDGKRTDRWLIAIDHGAVTVSHAGGQADCTIRAERDLFDQLCRGEANALAAMLRGALLCTGDVELLYAIQRVFPGPPGADRTAEGGSR
jgi:predicted lipid carrier protein YhbT